MIETAGWPIKIREYIKLRNTLEGAINTLRNELRNRITAAYNATFDQLESGCNDEGVPTSVLQNRQDVIRNKVSSNSIPVLQTCLNTNQFFAEQSARIMAAKPKPVTTPVSPVAGGSTTTTQPSTKTVTVDLHTRTIAPLKSEAEVDKYLANLKQQMMAEINKGNSVKIIK